MPKGKPVVSRESVEADLFVGGATRAPDLTGVIADSEVDELYMTFASVESEVIKELAQQGLDIEERFASSKPSTAYPQVDMEQLDKEGSAGYNRVYTELLSWLNYVTTLQARSQNELLSTKNALDQVSAKIRNSLVKDGTKTDALDYRMRINPVYIKALKAHQKAKERDTLIESYRLNLERDLRAVSRSVTIRGQSMLMSPEGRRIVEQPQTSGPSGKPHSPYRGIL